MPDSSPHTVVETEFPVRYAETDAMAVVHHASYIVYFEEARCHYMREQGSEYALVEADGFRLPVTEVHVRYVGSLVYGDRVRVRTWIAENKSRKLTFAYEIMNDKDDYQHRRFSVDMSTGFLAWKKMYELQLKDYGWDAQDVVECINDLGAMSIFTSLEIETKE